MARRCNSTIDSIRPSPVGEGCLYFCLVLQLLLLLEVSRRVLTDAAPTRNEYIQGDARLIIGYVYL